MNIVAGSGAKVMFRPAKAKMFFLEGYGLKIHCPAIVAELCLDNALADRLHQMLCRIRIVNLGSHQGMLRSSAAPLPKKEPWLDILRQAPAPLCQIMMNRSISRIENMTARGERGDHRDLKPSTFTLTCPKCSVPRECAHVKLHSCAARGLTCLECRASTTSTKWCCGHGAPWTSCSVHREAGFRCGPRSLLSHEAPFSRPFQAIKARLSKLRRLGSLGDSSHLVSRNSASLGSSFKTMVKKKN